MLTSGGGGATAMSWTTIGTSGSALPLLNTANTWSAQQSFTFANGTIRVSDTGTSFSYIDIAGGGTVLRFGQEGSGGGNNLILNSAANDGVINMRDNKRLLIGTNNTAALYVYASGGLAVGVQSDPGAGGIIANTSIKTGATTVAGLPTCNAGAKGLRYFVTDANSATYHATAVGGGGNVTVVCDGTIWYIN